MEQHHFIHPHGLRRLRPLGRHRSYLQHSGVVAVELAYADYFRPNENLLDAGSRAVYLVWAALQVS